MPDLETTETETQEGTESGEGAETNQDGSEAEGKETNLSSEKPGSEGSDDQDEFETLEDGRIAVTVGESTYYGSTRQEAWTAMKKGIAEKDKAFKERSTELNELKARRAIRDNVGSDEGEEMELPPAPKRNDYLATLVTQRGLEPRMLNWNTQQWKEYASENNLESWEVQEKRDALREAQGEAERSYQQATVTWINQTTVRHDITPAVQRLVAKSGLDPEEFGEVYLQALRDKANRNADGLISGSKVLESMGTAILEKTRTAKQASVSAKLKDEKDKLDERKRLLSGSRSAHQTPNIKNKKPADINEASKMALKMLRG